MYDDVLSATTLVGVATVIAAVFVGAAVEPRLRSPVAMAHTHATVAPVAQTTGPQSEAMPIYELPRVVVKGQRSRDGDVLATTGAKPPLGQAAPYRSPAR